MDIYQIWCDLKPGTGDIEFVDAVTAYCEHLKSAGDLAGYRILRRKLGLSPPEFSEFLINLEFENLGQLDGAFNRVSARSDPVESFHAQVNSKVVNLKFALYRDFPDSHRQRGQERF